MSLYEQYNKIRPLSPHLADMVGDKKSIRILDVGSGPYPITGQQLDGVDVSIVWCDRKDFSDGWKRANDKPLFPIDVQDMELLTYPNESFDIVNCVNALDHTKGLLRAVLEMERVCKVGGHIYIDCSLNQLDTGHKHHWNAKADGTFDNHKEIIDLKKLGFTIRFIDLGGESRYNHVIAIKQK